MTGEELERLEELEEMVEAGDLDKEDDPDTWEELKWLRATLRTEKKAAKALDKWRKAKTVLYVSLRDPDPDNDISFYVWDRAGLEAVACKQSWVDGLIDAVTITEVDPKTVGDVRFQEHEESFYSVADLNRWKAIEQESNEKWEREHAEEIAANKRAWDLKHSKAADNDAASSAPSTTAIVPVQTVTAIQAAGQVANVYAAANAFADYIERKAQNTLDAQRGDLATFADYLCDATAGADCPTADQLQHEPQAWHGMTHGLVTGFVRWLLGKGYAIGSVNRKLSTVRVYARLAAQAGVIAATDATLIRGVAGYGGTEGKRQDEKRTEAQQATRTGHKKAQHVTISKDQAQALKAQPDTPQGRRDAVIMCLLLDHGLRVGELASLSQRSKLVGKNGEVEKVDTKSRKFTFFRRKVDKWQTHRMTDDTHAALVAWLKNEAPTFADENGRVPLLRGSRKAGKQKDGPKGAKVHGNGALTSAGMTDRAITERVRTLGAAVGIVGLSAHDCRHYWATRAATMGTDSFALRDAGGWNSLAMPSRYVEAATIANERVKL